MEVLEIFDLSGIQLILHKDIYALFGIAGRAESGELSFSNAYIEKHNLNRQWVEWLESTHKSIFSKDTVLNTFTSIRRQTAIGEKGIKKEHSLRTSRVLNRGLKFSSRIEASENIENKQIEFLSFAARNLRHIGTNRNRGFGLVSCSLSGTQVPNYEKSLEKLQSVKEV
jgi:RAMP superfamily